MHRNEFEYEVCARCGEMITDEIRRTYQLTPEVILCYRCCTNLGGVFTEEDESWRMPPDLSGGMLPSLWGQAAR